MLNLDTIQQHAEARADDYGENFKKAIYGITLSDLEEVDFFCYKAARSHIAGNLVASLIEVRSHLIRDELLSCLFQDIAAFIVEEVYGGSRSTMRSVDLEFKKKDVHYLISVKPDLAWGAGWQRKELGRDLSSAASIVRDSGVSSQIEAILGISYGRQRKFYMKSGHLVAIGKQFWYLVYENHDLYTDIIEPIYQESHEEMIAVQKDALTNRLTFEFVDKFCKTDGSIDWIKLVEFNSGNFDLDKFL